MAEKNWGSLFWSSVIYDLDFYEIKADKGHNGYFQGEKEIGIVLQGINFFAQFFGSMKN